MSIEAYCADWPWILEPSLQSYKDHPQLDSDSAWVFAKAVAELAVIRCPSLGMGDSLAELHASVSLLHQGLRFLPAVVADARAQDRSWTKIAGQLDLTPTTLRRIYRTKIPVTVM